MFFFSWKKVLIPIMAVLLAAMWGVLPAFAGSATPNTADESSLKLMSEICPAFSGRKAPATTAPAIPTDRPITLEEAINYALAKHPRIRAAESNVTVSKFQVLQSEATFWPQVAFQATRDYIWYERAVRFGPSPVSISGNYIANNFTFSGNWTVFDFGRTWYNMKTSKALEKAVQEDLSTTEQGVAYDVMDAYFNLLKAQSLVKVAQETLDDANGHLKQAQAFFDVGVKPKYDVTQAEVQVNNAKVQLIQAEDAVTAARINLNTRLAIDPMAPTAVVDVPELETLGNTLNGYLQEALVNRPELIGLQDRLKSSEMNVRAQLAGYLPSLSVKASYSWYKEDHTDFLNNSDALLEADVPIFEGFLTTSLVGQARASVIAAKYKIEDTKQDILNQVSQAYLAIQDAKASYEGLQATVKSARENLDIAQGRYEAGVGAILDVTDAQVSLTSAEANLAQAFYNYHLAYSRLLRSTGKNPKK